MKNKLFPFSLGMIGILFLMQSCAPVFSELQGARMAGKGNVEALPYYTSTSASSDGETDGIQNHAGLQVAYGLSPKVDIRARFENIWEKEGDFGDGISIFGIGPKFSLLENNIAFYLPIGRALGDGTSDSWELIPTMLFTLPAVQNKLDINFSPKYIIPFCEDCEGLFAMNLGLAISSDLSKWSIRPEYGQAYNLGEEGHYGQFSIGASVTLSKK